jgi:hypothetical protein
MTIRSVYDNPLTTTRDAELLAKRAKVTVKSARAFLRDQAAQQVTRRSVKPRDELFAPTGGPYGQWLGDVIFLSDFSGVNDKRGAIFTLLEVNSRYVYSRALIRTTAAKVAVAMGEILAQNKIDVKKIGVAPILSVRTDGGPENSGAFAALLKKHGIPHEKGEAGTHERLSRLDRFHLTLRTMIGDLFAVSGSQVWYPYLQSLIQNYNERPHRGLAPVGKKLAPIDIDRVLEGQLRLHDSERASQVRQLVNDSGIKKGTKVRLLLKRAQPGRVSRFAKANEAVWTSAVYVVSGRAGPNSFTVAGVPHGAPKVWPIHALQVVKKALGAKRKGPKVDLAVLRAKKLESRNISFAEQAKALAAPARPKRVSKPSRRLRESRLSRESLW